jgi:hypothetical protein
MRHAIVGSLILSTVVASPLCGQDVVSRRPERGGVSLLYEAAVGLRLTNPPRTSQSLSRVHASWEAGTMVNRPETAWGATVLATVGPELASWGVRPRYRLWLSGKTCLDVGAGVLLGGWSEDLDQSYPGFTGLVALRHGRGSDWVGVDLELQAIPTKQDYYYDPTSGEQVWDRRQFTDWGLYLSGRLGGRPALVATLFEFLVVGAVLLEVAESF